MNSSYFLYIGVAGGTVLGVLAAAIVIHFFRRKRGAKKTGALNAKLEVEKLKSDIILNSIEDGVIVADANNVVQVFNPSASRLTSWPQNEAIGLDYHLVIKLVDSLGAAYTDDNNPLKLALLQAKTIRDNTAILVSKDNNHISVNVSASPLMGNNDRPSGVVCIFQDVSKQRQEEQKRAEFISTASHEMRTPVAAIEGYLALAMNTKVSQIDDKARQFLIKAHSSTQHLGELFQDLLTSAKAEDGRLINHPAIVEMGKYIEQLTEDLRFAAQKKGLGLEFIMGTPAEAIHRPDYTKVIQPLYYAKVDPNRVREVVTNLFDNAVKYTPSGKITLGITGDDEVVQLSVKDTGTGIPPEDIPHLFQKFYRVDNSATRTIGGTGLGLFICRKIFELYNGRIWVESESGKGSTFYINFPRLSTQQAQSIQTEIAPSDTLHVTPQTYMKY